MESKRDPRLDRLLAECDVETYRGSGPGGQHRNRRDSAVRLTHRPTRIVVTATERRSQHQNKAVALERLAAKLAARGRRRRPRIATRPTRSAAERRLEGKARRAEVKSGRGPSIKKSSE
jgi:protein subunit release factor B